MKKETYGKRVRRHGQSRTELNRTLLNILEALIGAIFVDKGYEKCKKILGVIFFKPYIELNTLENEVVSYKSLLIEWSQKNKEKLVFETEADSGMDPDINFYCKIVHNDKVLTKSRDISKKKTLGLGLFIIKYTKINCTA